MLNAWVLSCSSFTCRCWYYPRPFLWRTVFVVLQTKQVFSMQKFGCSVTLILCVFLIVHFTLCKFCFHQCLQAWILTVSFCSNFFVDARYIQYYMFRSFCEPNIVKFISRCLVFEYKNLLLSHLQFIMNSRTFFYSSHKLVWWVFWAWKTK